MDRREFLRAAGMASLCAMVPGVQAWAVEAASEKAAANKLVVVFLRGAIDGLSVVVPYSDPGYYAIRPKIAIPRPGGSGAAIALDRDFALHPSLAPLMPLWLACLRTKLRLARSNSFTFRRSRFHGIWHARKQGRKHRLAQPRTWSTSK